MEHEFVKLLDSLEHGHLVSIVSTFLEAEQIQKILIDNLSDDDKKTVIKSFEK